MSVPATVGRVTRLAIALVAAASLAGLASAATVTGTPRADTLIGTSRADVLDGRGGSDTISGLAGSDLLRGGPGRDVVDAGTGDDRIPAHGDPARDRVRCGTGRDIVTAGRNDVISKDCEVVSRQLAADTTSDPIGQHATQAEPDTFAFGSTVVSVYQVGRVFSGGAVAIGFATSRDAGVTWKSGLLPGVTDSSPRPGQAERASDPVIAYDAEHGTWLAVTLGISERTSSYYLYVNRSADGLAWGVPTPAVSSRAGDLDKEWITCDNGASSPYRGSCYLSYFDVGSGEIRTTSSTDGGLTWSVPVASSPVPPQEFDYNGAQPVVLPDGTLVVVYTAFGDPRFGARSELVATRSTDGGATFSAPVRVSPLSTASIPAMRTFALSSAEVDAAGRIYVTWEGCPGPGSCSASRIVLSTSVDGVSWTPAQSVTAGSPAVDHFLPGLAAGASGRLALVYHSIPDDCASDPTCPGVDVFHTTSKDGGRSWSRQQRLTAESIALDSIARTRIGLMLGDYVSTSFVRGRPVSVFVVASERINGRFRQAAFAYR